MSLALEDFFMELTQLGVRLWLEGEQLKFSAKHGVMTEKILDRLKAEKSTIIRYLSQLASLQQPNQAPPARIARIQGYLYLTSSAQKRLWFMEMLSEQASPQYNITIIIKMLGLVDVDKIKRACELWVERHEILRTRLIERQGELYQEVLPTQSLYEFLRIPIYSVDKQADRDSLIIAQAHAIFDLKKIPLFSLMLIKHAANTIELVMTAHHIIVDAISIEILFADLVDFYNDKYLADKKYVDQDYAMQYIDFVAWHNNILEAERAKQLDYWRNMLGGATPILEFPYDYSRPAELKFAGAYCTNAISITKTVLNYFLVKHQILTPIAFWLSAYAVLLYRYTHQNIFIIGIPVSNRRLKEFEKTVGLLVNSLPVKIVVSDQQHFIDLIEQVSEQLIFVQQNSDMPLDDLIAELLLERKTSHAPLFQTMFLYEERMLPCTAQNVQFSLEGFDTNISKFDLSLVVCLDDQKHILSIEYNTQLLRESTVKQVAKHFNCLCEQFIAEPLKQLDHYELLSIAEQKHLILDGNDTEKVFDKAVQIQELFAMQADICPDAVAIYDCGKALSYRELNNLANQLAGYLISIQQQKNGTIGVLLDRSIDAVVAILAVLKSASTFVPLDPAYPDARLSYSLSDANAGILITSVCYVEKIASHYQGVIIAIDDNDKPWLSYPNTAPLCKTSMQDLAYIIYTSGSTGKPKGVMISHLNISHYIQWAIDFYQVKNGVGAPVHSSLAFDLTMTSIFAPLCCGRTVFMISDELGFQGLIDALNDRQDYSLIKLTPAHLRRLQVSLNKQVIEVLQATIVIGGEALYEEDVSYWRKWGKNLRLVNEYGPTEITVANTVYELPRHSTGGYSTAIPIGKPIANSQIYILDNYQRVLPIGVVGEIYLSGIGLAQGYLNLPKMTAEKFFPHPFAKYHGEKIYKTGDRGRMLIDGNVEYLGRLDDQIKINGYRIELGEISVLLESCDFIKQSTIKVWLNTEGENYIAAYFVPIEISFDKNQLREFLRKILPHYMLPSAYVVLTEIPLTINGKVDKQALPKPQEIDFVIKNNYQAPRNHKERILCELWSELFAIPLVSIYDNFFALGGDSIISIQFIAKLREKGWSLTVKQLFAQQIIADLALVMLNNTQTVLADQGLLVGECPLMPAQQWFVVQEFVQPNHFNQSFILLADGVINIVALEAAITKLLLHHDALRFCYKDGQQIYRQELNDIEKYLTVVTVPFLMLEEQVVWVTEHCNEYQSRLDISKGLNLQCICFKGLVDDQDRMALIIHHWVIDGVSWRILLEDLNLAYQGKLLPEKTSSCRDWANYCNGNRPVDSSQNIQMIDVSYSPVDSEAVYHFPAIKKLTWPVYHIAKLNLSSGQTAVLLSQVASISAVPKIQAILLTVLGCALVNIFNHKNFLIELESHGRDTLYSDIDLSRTVGWFTNQYPFNLQIANNREESFLQVLAGLVSSSKNNVDASLCKIGFNYLGQFSESNKKDFFTLTDQSAGEEISPANHAWHLIAMNSWILQGKLAIELRCHPDILTTEQFEVFNAVIKQEVDNFIDHIIPNFNIADVLPATPAQKLMWNTSVDCVGSYITRLSWKVILIDFTVYQQAWQLLCQEILVLRSNFKQINNSLYQIFYNTVLSEWELLDGDELNKTDDKINNAYREILDLSAGQIPMRFFYQAIGKNNYCITWVYHHALLDGWSLPLLLKRLQQIYEALLEKKSIPRTNVPNLAGYYHWLAQCDYKKAASFWHHTLAVETRFIASCSKSTINNISPQIETLKINSELLKSIDQFTIKHSITLGTLIQFVWGMVLTEIKQSKQVCFAVMTAGRSAEIPQVVNMVGMLLQIIPIVWNYEFESEDFNKENLNNIHNKFLDNLIKFNQYINQCREYGFYDWYEKYKIELDSLVVHENYLDSADIMALDIKSHTHYPLTVVGLPNKEGLTIAIEYNGGIFSAVEVKNILQQLERILEMVVKDICHDS